MSNSIHFIKTEKSARVVMNGKATSDTKQVWLVAHGYGYLATLFINKFSELNSKINFVIVPEGLHRYYLNGFSGKVGASWMTKEDREHDIEDYCNYLDKVYEEFISPFNKNVIINILGFSQGGATITRWASQTKFKIDNLIVWGSNVPEDIIPITIGRENDFKKLKNINWFYVCASDDEFMSQELQLAQIELLKKRNINPEVINYTGKHDIDSETLMVLADKCGKLVE